MINELALFTEKLRKKTPAEGAQGSLDLKKKAAEEWERMDKTDKEVCVRKRV
jgi:hypothetical protein